MEGADPCRCALLCRAHLGPHQPSRGTHAHSEGAACGPCPLTDSYCYSEHSADARAVTAHDACIAANIKFECSCAFSGALPTMHISCAGCPHIMILQRLYLGPGIELQHDLRRFGRLFVMYWCVVTLVWSAFTHETHPFPPLPGPGGATGRHRKS